MSTKFIFKNVEQNFVLAKLIIKGGCCPDWVAQLVGGSKDCRFNSKSEHIFRLGVQFQLGHIQEAADGCFSLISMFLSLSSFVSEVNKNILG